MSTGATPFSGSSAAVVMTRHLTEQVPWPQDVNPELSEHVCVLIQKMMARNRGDRYQTPTELIADVELVVAGKPPRFGMLSAAASSIGQRGVIPVKPRPAPPTPRPRSSHATPARSRRRRRLQRSTIDTAGTRPLNAVGRGRKGLSTSVIAILAACLLGATGIFIYSLSGQSDGDDFATKMTIERDAAASWERKIGPFADRENLTVKEAAELLTALGLFRGRFETTSFIRTKADRIAQLEARISQVLADPGNLQQLLEDIQEDYRKNPGDYDAAIAAFEKARTACKGTKWETPAANSITEVKAARQQAADVALAAIRAEADALFSGGDYDAAIKRWGRPPSGLARVMAAGLTAGAKSTRERAEAKFKLALAEIEKLSRDGWPGSGLEKIETLAAVKYAAGKERIAGLKTRLNAQLKKANQDQDKRLAMRARENFLKTLAYANKLMLASDTTRAATFVKIEIGSTDKKELSLVTRELNALQKIATSLAGRKGARSATPASPEDHLANVISGIVEKDFAAAGKSLRGAGQHLLATHYAKLLKSVWEPAARKAWESEVAPLKALMNDRPSGEKMLKALATFASKHGETSFGKNKAAEAKAMAESAKLLVKASGPAKPAKPRTRLPLEEQVKLLFAGKVRGFNKDTLAIDILYDFEDPRQLGDWSQARSGKFGRSKTLLATTTGACSFVAPITASRMSFVAGCERSASPHIAWFFGSPTTTRFLNAGLMSPKRAATMLYATGGKQRKDRPVIANHRYRMTLSIDDDKLYWQIDRHSPLAARYKTRGKIVALAGRGTGTRCHFDNVRLIGVLDKTWLETALTAIPGQGEKVIFPEADAYVGSGKYASSNYGLTGSLIARKTDRDYGRAIFMRFDLSALRGKVVSARLRLTCAQTGYYHRIGLVKDDSWKETGITWQNKPSSGPALLKWSPTAQKPVSLDMTALVRQELKGDRKLSLRIWSDNAAYVTYGSRESARLNRPMLIVETAK
jgi:hypothetical protein